MMAILKLGVLISILTFLNLFNRAMTEDYIQTHQNIRDDTRITWTFENILRDCLSQVAKCFKIPHTCSSLTDCPMIIALVPDVQLNGENTYNIRMIGPEINGPSYVAIGFRRLEILAPLLPMDNALVLACTRDLEDNQDQTGFGQWYTDGNNIIPMTDYEVNDDNWSISVKIIENRIFCEFNRRTATIVRRPITALRPTTSLVTFNLDEDAYNIMIANGIFGSDSKMPLIHKFTDRFITENIRLPFTECGRSKMCLGAGKDGCGLVRSDCHMFLSIKPLWRNGNMTGKTIGNTTKNATISEVPQVTLEVEMESQNCSVVALGFGMPENSSRKLVPLVRSIPFLITCERSNPTSPPEVQVRWNNCYNSTFRNPGTCSATRLSSVSWSWELQIKDITFGEDVDSSRGRAINKAKSSWLRCRFKITGIKDVTKINPAPGINLPENFTFNWINSTLYTALVEGNILGPNVSLSFGSIVNMVSTRLATKIWDETRFDFQIQGQLPTTLENRKRELGSINPESHSGYQSSSEFLIVVCLALIL